MQISHDVETHTQLVAPSRPRVRDRVTARLRARRLDAALAAGAAPESSPSLALRAQRLTSLPRRRQIARALQRIVREAHEPAARSLARVAPARRQVVHAREELGRLGFELAEPGPVRPQGVAQAMLLLTDGTGPLYNPRTSRSLQRSAAAARQRLRPA